jgi:hypothetical protein
MGAAIFDFVSDLAKDHWQKILISLLSLLFGAWYGKHRAKRNWAKKEFLDRINFSLNSVVDGTLRIRTLVEKNVTEVFLNSVAVDKVNHAAGRTTEQSPFLPLAKEDRWFLLNAVLNEVSEKFAEGFLRRDLGLPVRSDTFLICLTNESAGDLRTRKIRAMVVQRKLLTALPADEPKYERPHHNVRWHTLHQMAAAYQTDPEQFLEVELVLPAT